MKINLHVIFATFIILLRNESACSFHVRRTKYDGLGLEAIPEAIKINEELEIGDNEAISEAEVIKKKYSNGEIDILRHKL